VIDRSEGVDVVAVFCDQAKRQAETGTHRLGIAEGGDRSFGLLPDQRAAFGDRRRSHFILRPSWSRIGSCPKSLLREYACHVHSGIAGVADLKDETFAHLCGVAYTITIECYILILESIIDGFRTCKTDEKLKNRITFAKIIPFADMPEQAELRVSLLGE
jgi:hypothetical protein